MKIPFLILTIVISVSFAKGQAISSFAEIVTTHSQNERYYLKSIPYDNEIPSLRGKTSVYEKGSASPLYVFERGFDFIGNVDNDLILSNNGEVIFYVIPWGANEEAEGLKSVTVYKMGRIHKSFTETEITGCDKKKERCSLLYSNYEQVVDEAKSNSGTRNYKKAFKEGVDERERFLSDFPVFSFDDIVYLTDSKKKVHLFDLREGDYIRSESFDTMFEQIKDKGRFSKTELQRFDAPTLLDFPKLKNGRDTYASLAAHIDMKPADIMTGKDEQFKLYSFEMNGILSQDGSLEIEDIEFHDELPKEKIVGFFKTNKFDSSSVPKVVEKWALRDEYFYFRNKNDRIARQEKQQEIIKQRQELERRTMLERIDDVYIPNNLGECFVELDRLLPEVDKKEMQALPKREDMIRYHMGLGTWMRNNWGLWGGSRLQKYFADKGITHPEEMSSVILYHYYDWLSGKKEIWKEWEKNPNRR